MKCDHCNNPAITHEVTIQGGKKIERHLCKECSKKHNIDPAPTNAVNQILSNIQAMQGLVVPGARKGAAEQARPLKCEACGMTFADFKQHALLGCPECYVQMESQLGPIIERAHEGATHHVGKIPRRALEASREGGGRRTVEAILGSARERAERVSMLRRQLEEAIRAEQYERAARIRDEMRSLGEAEAEENPA
ncbi:MAG: UvrB/UvrC motif-containing protein [Phycisphaeraceae bacterium]|nr:UvrB/UvrC motif-containing protein [Phycisphaeraceae bacterium]MCW5754505.1 UvrB/UvrC motif-containing protein [Phycisphaeraceae bacterium]